MHQKEDFIDPSSATPGPDAYIDGGASSLQLDLTEMAPSRNLELRLFPKSSRVWRKLPVLKNLFGKKEKDKFVGDWREEDEVPKIFILLPNNENELKAALL